jgi:hypothetical protein
MGSVTYPVQPTSSHAAARKNTTKKSGIVDQGMYGAGSGRPKRSMTPYESTMIRGIKNMMGTYQILCLILLKSKTLFKSLFTPPGFSSLYTRMNAEMQGQTN